MTDRTRSAASASRHVLFALRDEAVAQALARVVESRAHVGRVARSIEDAILGGPADVVVADLGGASDTLDGLALVDAFRDLESDPLVVLVASADCTSEDLDRATAARADFVLERPLLPGALVSAIESERDEQTSRARSSASWWTPARTPPRTSPARWSRGASAAR